jgi:hypothetical protein
MRPGPSAQPRSVQPREIEASSRCSDSQPCAPQKRLVAAPSCISQASPILGYFLIILTHSASGISNNKRATQNRIYNNHIYTSPMSGDETCHRLSIMLLPLKSCSPDFPSDDCGVRFGTRTQNRPPPTAENETPSKSPRQTSLPQTDSSHETNSPPLPPTVWAVPSSSTSKRSKTQPSPPRQPITHSTSATCSSDRRFREADSGFFSDPSPAQSSCSPTHSPNPVCNALRVVTPFNWPCPAPSCKCLVSIPYFVYCPDYDCCEGP